MQELDASVPIYNLRTLERQIERSLLNERLIATLSTAFGALATLLAVVGLGVTLGLIASWAVGRLIGNQLYGITPNDPATMIAAALTLGVVALLAGYLPARRATRVNPMLALRYE